MGRGARSTSTVARSLDSKGKMGSGARVGNHQTTVRTADATAFLTRLHSTAPIALKLDVEGSEYDILRDLMMSGVLCRSVSTLWVEFHATNGAEIGTPHQAQQVFEWMLRSHTTPMPPPCSKCGCRTEAPKMRDDAAAVVLNTRTHGYSPFHQHTRAFRESMRG